jgi:hypothetical protein
MLLRRRSGQTGYVELRQIAKKELGRASPVSRGEFDHTCRRKDLGIGGQSPEAFIDNAALFAKGPNIPVVMRFCVEAVLDQRGLDPSVPA